MIRTIEQDFCFAMFLTRLSQRSATCRNGDKKASFRSAGSGLIDKDVVLQTDTHVIGHTKISRSARFHAVIVISDRALWSFSCAMMKAAPVGLPSGSPREAPFPARVVKA
jgi:hypothetical protein